jgi:hypothetical protein
VPRPSTALPRCEPLLPPRPRSPLSLGRMRRPQPPLGSSDACRRNDAHRSLRRRRPALSRRLFMAPAHGTAQIRLSEIRTWPRRFIRR